MKYIILSVCLLAAYLPGVLGQEKQDIISFFPSADSLALYPEVDRPLELLCEKKIPQTKVAKVKGKYVRDTSYTYVSFLGYRVPAPASLSRDKNAQPQTKIFIAAITNQPIKNPNGEIFRLVDFDGFRPVMGKVTTWGYIFDRNNDSNIDYLALVDGAAAFKDDRMPPDFPARGQNLTRPQVELFISRCKIIFNHWADDNFDGKIDAAVHVDGDKLRDWVERRIVIRSTAFNDSLDDAWAFRTSIKTEHEKIEHSNSSVPYRQLGKFDEFITPDVFKNKTNILQLLNRAASQCDIGKDVTKD